MQRQRGRSATEPQPNRAKRLECVVLGPALHSPHPSRQRQQAGRTPNASRQILAACEEVELLQCRGDGIFNPRMNRASADTAFSNIRAFIAIPIDPVVIKEIVDWQQTLRKKLAPTFVRWVRSEQIHLTLRFFGNVPADQLPGIEAATRSACAAVPEFKLAAQGIGCFPNPRSPRIVWAGIIGDVGILAQLQQAIVEPTRGFGRPPEDRSFQPHLTIGRIKQPQSQSKEILAKHVGEAAVRNFGEWRVAQVDLMRRVLSPQGSTYSILATIPLIRQPG